MKPIVSTSPSYLRLSKALSCGVLAASALLLSAGQLSAQTQTTTVYQSNFAVNRDGWFNSNPGSGLSISNGALVGTNTSSQFLTYFDATTLAVGSSLQIQFGVSLQGSEGVIPNVDLGLRIGVFNSGNQKVSADSFGYSNDVFTGYTGYRFATNPSNTTSQNRTRIARRGIGTNTSPLGSNPWDDIATTGNATNLTAGQFYPVVITISRTDAETLGLSFSLNNIIVNTTDISPDSFTFDTLVFNKASGIPGSIMINDVVITYTSQIPEAGQTATAIGVITIIMASVILRRRKSRS